MLRGGVLTRETKLTDVFPIGVSEMPEILVKTGVRGRSPGTKMHPYSYSRCFHLRLFIHQFLLERRKCISFHLVHY